MYSPSDKPWLYPHVPAILEALGCCKAAAAAHRSLPSATPCHLHLDSHSYIGTHSLWPPLCPHPN